MLTAQVEPWADFIVEAQPMLPRHWEELALNQDKVPLDPMYEIYDAKDAAGQLMVVAMRSAGELVGYFIAFVGPGLHYRTCLTLTMDIFWIAPEHRGQRGGAMLFDTVKNEAKRRGVQRMFVGSKCHKDASFLFEALGYERCEVFYTVWLGD